MTFGIPPVEGVRSSKAHVILHTVESLLELHAVDHGGLQIRHPVEKANEGASLSSN